MSCGTHIPLTVSGLLVDIASCSELIRAIGATRPRYGKETTTEAFG